MPGASRLDLALGVWSFSVGVSRKPHSGFKAFYSSLGRAPKKLYWYYLFVVLFRFSGYFFDFNANLDPKVTLSPKP